MASCVGVKAKGLDSSECGCVGSIIVSLTWSLVEGAADVVEDDSLTDFLSFGIDGVDGMLVLYHILVARRSPMSRL